MNFDSKYRRQALQIWEQSRHQTLEELATELGKRRLLAADSPRPRKLTALLNRFRRTDK